MRNYNSNQYYYGSGMEIAPQHEGLAPWQQNMFKNHKENYFRKCTTCEKEIDIYPNSPNKWAYKRGSSHNLLLFCSYSCMCKYDELRKGTKRTGRKMKYEKY